MFGGRWRLMTVLNQPLPKLCFIENYLQQLCNLSLTTSKVFLTVGIYPIHIHYVDYTYMWVRCIVNCLLICIYRANYNGTGRNLSLIESLRPLVPVAILFSLVYVWAAFSPTDIIYNHPRCFYSLSAILFANITVSVDYAEDVLTTQYSSYSFKMCILKSSQLHVCLIAKCGCLVCFCL